MTNGEWIRAKTDEGLARFMDDVTTCHFCPVKLFGKCEDDKKTCEETILDWLKDEHKAEEE